MAIVFTQQEANEYLRRQAPYTNAIQSIDTQVEAGVKGINTSYQNALKDVNLNYGNNMYNLGLDLSQAMSDAFTTASQQRSSFLSQAPNLSVGQRENIEMNLENTMINAYDSYLKKYNESRQNLNLGFKSDVSKLQTNKASELLNLYEDVEKTQQVIDSELLNQSKNYAALANAPMEYLKKTWKDNLEVFKSGPLSKYTYFENGERKLISDLELNSIFFEDTENGKVLTDAGKEFYGTILYGLGDGSFDEYLKSSDLKLYEWAIDSNVYGDSAYKNPQGYSSNFDAVFGALGLSDIVSSGRYDTTNSIFKSKYEDSYDTSYVNKNVMTRENLGSISERSSDGISVYRFNDLRPSTNEGPTSELNWNDVLEGKAETFRMVYNDNEYKFKIKKAEASEDIVNKIISVYGKIDNQSIYSYDGKFYIGVDIDGKGNYKLRELKPKGKDFKSAFGELQDEQ